MIIYGTVLVAGRLTRLVVQFLYQEPIIEYAQQHANSGVPQMKNLLRLWRQMRFQILVSFLSYLVLGNAALKYRRWERQEAS